MIIPIDSSIDVNKLSTAFTSFVELSYLTLPPGSTLFDEPHKPHFEDAIESFITHIEDNDENTFDIWLAFCWLLNLPKEKFDKLILETQFPFPKFDSDEIRKFLEILWDRSFGQWRVRDLDYSEISVSPQKYE